MRETFSRVFSWNSRVIEIVLKLKLVRDIHVPLQSMLKLRRQQKIRPKLRSFSRPGLPFSETCEHLHAPKNDKELSSLKKNY